MDTKKLAKSAAGGVAIGFGVAAKLSELGLSVTDVVLGGAVNLANSFVPSNSSKNFGSTVLSKLTKGAKVLSAKSISKGKELMR